MKGIPILIEFGIFCDPRLSSEDLLVWQRIGAYIRCCCFYVSLWFFFFFSRSDVTLVACHPFFFLLLTRLCVCLSVKTGRCKRRRRSRVRTIGRRLPPFFFFSPLRYCGSHRRTNLPLPLLTFGENNTSNQSGKLRRFWSDGRRCAKKIGERTRTNDKSTAMNRPPDDSEAKKKKTKMKDDNITKREKIV